MKVLVFGANGQLGRCLCPMLRPHEVIAPGRRDVDFERRGSIEGILRESNPDQVINLAAYTAVDLAESNYILADVVNNLAVAEMAKFCGEVGTPLLQISTDFVFSGNQSTPYAIADECNPINRYGLSKLNGELAVQASIMHDFVILRTAWLYSDFGSNFLLTMLRLMRERKELRVVCDQIGTPTSAYSLANTVVESIRNRLQGIYHWTDAGVASWYDFSVAIYEEALKRDFVPPGVEIFPIQSVQYPTPAKRPHFSVLDKSRTYDELNLPPVHWRFELCSVLDRLAGRFSANMTGISS